jgi:ectoine hydroxylase-related dioxygenase (phytanoyl-CoA dioxygenase family)
MNVIPKSYAEGGLDHTQAKSEGKERPALLMANIDDSQAVPVPLLAGHGMVHHCLTLHQTNPNNSSRDRRAMVIHYMPVGTQNSKGEILADNLLLRGVNHFNTE